MYSATVTINGQTWSVSVATTPIELTTGLSGVVSLSPNNGMLFDLGSEQITIDINMTDMLFNLDVLFISEALVVVGKANNVPIGALLSFTGVGNGGARYFLEVNSGELADVSIGDSVSIVGYIPDAGIGIDINSMMGMMMVVMMMGMMMEMIK